MNYWDEVASKKKKSNKPKVGNEYSNLNLEKVQANETNSINDNIDNFFEKTLPAPPSLSTADVVIITAVETEYQIACRALGNKVSPFFFDGFKYSIIQFPINDDKIITIAILMQKNMGLVSAAIASTYAIKTSNPSLLLMCGVCAGVKGKTNLGDIIVFSPVFDYGAGKYCEGKFFPDYRQKALNGEIKQIIDQMSTNSILSRKIKDSWEYDIGKPYTELKIHIQPSGSGATVITDESIVEEIKKHQRTLVGIDMESFAIAEAAYEASLKEIPWLVVKGVQDFATPLKNDTYREYSAHVSAVFLKEFIFEYFKNKN